jgi:hypothetical protein
MPVHMNHPLRYVILFFITISSSFSNAQSGAKGLVDKSRIPVRAHHYEDEFLYDSSTDHDAWKKSANALNASFVSTDVLYLRREYPALRKTSLDAAYDAWKGERVNAQLLLWSSDTVNQVRVRMSALRGDKGKSIPETAITIRLVRFVLSNYPYGSTRVTCGEGPRDSVYLMPDRLEKFERFDLPGNSTRSVWISVDVPTDQLPGRYEGVLTVTSEKGNTTMKFGINVVDQKLPGPEDWKFRLDLWQNPWVVAWYYQLEPWSEEHKILLRKHMKLYADAGGKYITTYAVHSPWSDNSYMIEGGMIEWIMTKNGKWKFDYRIFDDYVSLAMEAGVDDAITIYTPVPWGNRFRYLDQTTGNYLYEEWSPETERYREIWNAFLTDLKSHLEEKGWMKKTYLGINENAMEVTLAAIKVIRDHSKDWRITYAGDWHPELSELLDDYSPIIQKEPTIQEVKTRKAKGLSTTFYVCCTPSKPNNFVFSPPSESTFIGWYAAAYGYDGFLRWAYDAWPEDPMRDARHTLWPAGDSYLVYPGGNSSIRFEKLREGIADFEKISILRGRAADSTDKKVKLSWSKFEAYLKSFIDNPAYAKRDYSTVRVTTLLWNGKSMLRSLSVEIK